MPWGSRAREPRLLSLCSRACAPNLSSPNSPQLEKAFSATRTQCSQKQKKVKVKVAQSCPSLCDPTDSTVLGILQAKILEWLPFPSPGDLPNPGTEPRSPALQVDSLPAEPQGKPPQIIYIYIYQKKSDYWVQVLTLSPLTGIFSKFPPLHASVSSSLKCG